MYIIPHQESTNQMPHYSPKQNVFSCNPREPANLDTSPGSLKKLMRKRFMTVRVFYRAEALVTRQPGDRGELGTKKRAESRNYPSTLKKTFPETREIFFMLTGMIKIFIVSNIIRYS